MRRCFSGWLVAAVFALGCHSTSSPPSAPDRGCALKLEVKLVLARLGMRRGLVLKHEVDVKLVSAEEFRALVVASALPASKVLAEQALTAMFRLRDVTDEAPRPSVSADIQTFGTGLYEEETRTLYLRDLRPGDDFQQLRIRLAHELEHALQHDAFGDVDTSKMSWDEASASVAITEGDARLAEWLVYPEQPYVVLPAMLRRESERAFSIVDPLKGRYAAGQLFLGRIFASGGPRAVDAVFHDRPASTEQLLHLEKYASGDAPTPVRVPPVAGAKGLLHMRVGELGVRWLLAPCLPSWEASKAAKGWGGDDLVIAERPDKTLAMRWVTTWDTESKAKQFESALEAQRSCWQKQLSTGGWKVPEAMEISRAGETVVLRAGDDLPIDALFASVGEDPGETRREVVYTTAEVVDQWKREVGIYRFTSRAVSVAIDRPNAIPVLVSGSSLYLDRPGPGPRLSASVHISTRYDPGLVLGSWTAQWAEIHDDLQVIRRDVALLSSKGQEAVLRSPAGALYARAFVLEIPGGAVLVEAIAHTAEDAKRLEDWTATIQCDSSPNAAEADPGKNPL